MTSMTDWSEVLGYVIGSVFAFGVGWIAGEIIKRRRND